jgi:hypothetical protein
MAVRMIVPLSQAAREALRRPIRGTGGFQTLLRRLQGQVNTEGLVLTLEDMEQLVRYGREYGVGGFQQRLGAVAEDLTAAFDAVRRALQ